MKMIKLLTSSSVEFSHEESVVVHVAEDEDDVAGPEGQLHFAVYVRGQLVRVVVVQSQFSPEEQKKHFFQCTVKYIPKYLVKLQYVTYRLTLHW